jgi:ribosomal protein S12 methylthiotransferase accessory factor
VIETTYLNDRRELLDALYGEDRQGQYDHLTRLYNPVLGPVMSVNTFQPDLLDLSMYGTSCSHLPIASLLRDLLGRGVADDSAGIPLGGKGPTAQQAFLGTLGEAAERLLAVLHSGAMADRIEYASHAQLQAAGRYALGPADVFLFSPQQYEQPGFPFEPFRPDTRLGWIEGTLLQSGHPILVPAQLALFFWKRHRHEGRIGYATSGGLAFHTNRRRAILHGLYENIERDAINLTWYCKIPPLRVEIDLEEFLRSLGLRYARMSTPHIAPVRLLLNSLDAPIPVFTAITVDDARDRQSLLAGGGSWSNRDRALIQALFEIGQMRTGFTVFSEDWSGIKPDTPPSELTDFFYASVVYGYRENLSRLHWYLESGDSISWEEVPSHVFDHEDEEYEWIMEWAKRAGLNPILFDFGSACWPGVHVTKVLIPELVQAFVPSWPYFGHRRFYEVPHAVGRSARRLELADLNADPLPFP